MKNKEKAIELLKRYKLIKQRCGIMREKLTALENLITSARGVTTNRIPSRGGSSKDYYRLKLQNYHRELADIDSALAELPEQERTALKIFFLDSKPQNCANALGETLGFERSHIYRIREKALCHLTEIYYARFA